MLPRRMVLATLLAAPALGHAPQAAAQPAWAPGRPIRFFQGFAPGGTTDILARLLAPLLAEALGQPVVVENRVGAGGTVAADALAKARPDGHTMMLLNNGFAAAAALFERLPYDPLADIAPATVVATMPLVLLVAANAPYARLAELLAAARARPDALNVATVGVGSTQHFVAEALWAQAGVRLTHIPYRGTPAALIALRNGEVQVVVETVGAVLGHISSGEVRALALSTAARFSGLPETATVAESGIGNFDLATWYAIGFPAGTPEAVLARIQSETRRALADPVLAARLGEIGLSPVGSSVAEARALVPREITRAREIATRVNIPRQ
ncbi:tripartite tricarboxylate transporter substrate binding protein [Roseomonas hellenica]|uniref:Tripartite tricarboxylate transporter substrate binding protein n=1 Tax=Plastoroseomonas hellenica TaxID=2687306 RepID=A0ABS5F1A7_9PROT|nr:tripartite tricarboxylate transporter substrate-binding protein [Plastoroseomonas hellenica]MBR0666263.1 tripartite tricarboxylate transporter substrate binding protein [Plastoroseomonas hellenica]